MLLKTEIFSAKLNLFRQLIYIFFMLLFFFTPAYSNREFIYPSPIGRGTIPVVIPQKYEIMPLTMLRFNVYKNTLWI